MRKKSESTIIERALDCVPGFGRVFQKLQQQVVLRGQSKSTLHNYISRVAAISLHLVATKKSAIAVQKKGKE